MKFIFSSALLLFLNLNLIANDALYMKYEDKAVNASTLVERQGLKYQVNTSTPFSGRFISYEDEFGFCVLEAGSYKRGLLHGPFEAYEGCGVAYSYKTAYKNGVEHGSYIEYDEYSILFLISVLSLSILLSILLSSSIILLYSYSVFFK